MKPTRKAKLSDATALQALSHRLVDAGSHIEGVWWKDQLSKQLISLLENDQESEIIDALESLTLSQEISAQDALASCVEDIAESLQVDINGKISTALLIAVPILSWSRYELPSGNLSKHLLSTLKTQFSAHMLSKSASLTLADYLFSPDQLPRSFTETRRLLETFVQANQLGTHLGVEAASLPETGRFLADIRYLLGAVVAPEGEPIFRWQETDGNAQAAVEAWKNQGLTNLEPLFSNCAFEGLAPNAYHTACRQADRAARPYAITASVSFLQAMTDLSPLQMQASIASCLDHEISEYRIGIGPADSNIIYQGTIWPMMDLPNNADDSDALQEIEATLHSCGVLKVTCIEGKLPAEFCDDCGMPHYPNSLGELVHTEMPEGIESANLTLH
jgi:hypothetical protein